MGRENLGRALWRALVVHRFAAIAIIDVAIWIGTIVLGLFLRFELGVPGSAWSEAAPAFLIVASAQLIFGIGSGMYLGRWQLGSFEEVAGLVRTLAAVGVTLAILDRFLGLVPLSIVAFAPVSALVLCGAVRYGWRLAVDRRKRPTHEHVLPMVVYGAGEGATQAITSMLRSPESPYLPVAIVDDDPRKVNLRVRGVPVRGAGRDLERVAAAVRAEVVLIAIPSADAALVREIARRATDSGLAVRVLPPVADLLDGSVDVSDIRPLTPEDLLGRRVIDTDIDAIAHYLAGKRVLVTGAGGSIGSELCRQVHRFAPASLVMLDRDESALHAVQLSIEGRALLDSDELVVADIRDRDRLIEVFEHHRPEVVFHAAALKHLPLLEMHPGEAVKTNIWGTQNVLDVAERTGVERFVNISTDKAADPCSVLGWSKRITERLTSHADRSSDRGTYLSVRFGNVLGSRGSVLTAFRAQIAAGGPVTITDPEVTRYFMTIEEAVELVIQAGAIGANGDVLVLDMGDPVRIADVARQMVEQSPRPIEIVYTGLRSGEKLHEVLLGVDEVAADGSHPMVTHVEVPALDPSELERLAPASQGLAGDLESLCSAGVRVST